MKAIKKEKSKRTTNSREYKIVTKDQDRYWDEGAFLHHSRGRFRWKKKQIFVYQVRMYRTWKYNRKTRWKI